MKQNYIHLKENIFKIFWDTTDFGHSVLQSIELVGNCFSADSVYIAERPEGKFPFRNTFVWHASGKPEGIVPGWKPFPDHTVFDADSKPVFINRTLLPPQASECLRNAGVCSVLQVPVQEAGHTYAYLGIVDYHRDREDWRNDQEVHGALSSLVKMIGIFLLKARYVQQNELYQAELAASEKRADAAYELLDAISSGIILVQMFPDGTARPLYGNLGIYRILKIPRTAIDERVPDKESAKLEGEYFDDFFANIPEPDIHRVRREYKNGYKEDLFSVEKYRLLCGDGSYVWVNADLRLCKEGPNYRTYYATYTDMTDEQELQNGLMLSLEKEKKISEALEAANQTKTEFLSRMSHEIRTPMNAIIGLTTIASDHMDERAKVEDCLAKIGTSSKQLLSIINDVLDMSKIEDGKMVVNSAPFQLHQLMENISSLYAVRCEEKGVTFDICFSDTGVEEECLIGDITRVQQILLNLIYNAEKFTKKDDSIRLSVIKEKAGEDRVMIQFIVADTGIGMKKEFLDRLFVPFEQEDQSFTRQYGGTGLGMSITKNLVELMDGTIQVESELGCGSRFTVKLPFAILQKKQEDPREDLEQDVEEEPIKCHILLCEDNMMNTEIAVYLLEEGGATVECAENGKIAVEKFFVSEPGTYDVILMDIMMPVMDGLEACRMIRGSDRPDAGDIPIIAITANAYDEDKRKSKDAGMNDHLSKPIEPQRLYEAIQKQLKQQK